MIHVFNRSHYEDVLVVRVKELAPEELWRSRYDSINDFERMLVREGTTILKFFLHISKDEQLEQFRERLERADKHWKFSANDVARARALGRVPAGLRGRDQRDQHAVGAVVRRPGRPQVVPQLVVARDRARRRSTAMDPRFPPPPDGRGSRARSRSLGLGRRRASSRSSR